ncbi:hypothetical protein EVAR_94657_1 [Eumeta japonica]|uniref:Uncharacterized protein n=1 Tax=Eumeta variegata TaxID=151549 RepID=A0A4C1UUX0_EUMVA|nr:hypothetical protein EVAR_94657_1 [Eumeta japonica]
MLRYPKFTDKEATELFAKLKGVEFESDCRRVQPLLTPENNEIAPLTPMAPPREGPPLYLYVRGDYPARR